MDAAHTASPTARPAGGPGAGASPKDTWSRKRDHLRLLPLAGPDVPADAAGCCPARARSADGGAGPLDAAPAAPHRDTNATRTDARGHTRSRSRMDAGTTRTSADALDLSRSPLLIGPSTSVPGCANLPHTAVGSCSASRPVSSKASALPEAFPFSAGTSAYPTTLSALTRAMTSLDYTVLFSAGSRERRHPSLCAAKLPTCRSAEPTLWNGAGSISRALRTLAK